MQFSEIKVRSKIIISVTNGTDMKAKFVTKVMKNCGNYLLAIPFMHKGMRINFSGKNVKIHMEVRDAEGALWSFKNCRIDSIRKNGLIYHKVICSMMNGIENRRGGRRFYIWENTVVHASILENPLYTKMRDVGPIGFSFVVDIKKQLDFKEGMEVDCAIKNSKSGEDVIFHGMIVRHENMEKYIAYGCKMENPPGDVMDYIKAIERKSIVVDAEI